MRISGIKTDNQNYKIKGYGSHISYVVVRRKCICLSNCTGRNAKLMVELNVELYYI